MKEKPAEVGAVLAAVMFGMSWLIEARETPREIESLDEELDEIRGGREVIAPPRGSAGLTNAVRLSVHAGILSLVASGCGVRGTGDAGPLPTIRGHYVWGAEVNVFRACGSESEHWVTAAPEVMTDLRDRYVAHDLPAYEAVFVEVEGEFGPVLDCGFCEAYDGSLRVATLLVMESPGPETCVTAMSGGSSSDG